MQRQLFVTLLLTGTVLLFCQPSNAQSVTRPTFTALQKIQELVEAERSREAQSLLETLVLETRDIPYDNAIANQYLAHTSVTLDQPARARKALKSALATTELPPELRADLNLFYGTVLIGEEEYDLALAALEEWMSVAEKPAHSQIFSLAYTNFKTGNNQRAESLLEQILAEKDNPPTSWPQLYYQVLFEMKKYRRAESVLLGMLGKDHANKQLWRMLANHHLQLEQSGKALATVMLTYLNELVTEPTELQQLVSMFSYMDDPEKSARLLQQFLDDGRLETNVETITLLSNLWLRARERDAAKITLKKSAAMAPDGSTYELLAGVYFEDEEWADAYASYQQAINAGNLKEPQRVHLLAGISAMRAGKKEEAKTALLIAADSKKYAKQANGLIKMMEKKKPQMP